MSQTTFSVDPSVAVAGLIAQSSDYDAVSGIAAVDGLVPGCLVVRDSNDRVTLPQAQPLEGSVLGILIYEAAHEPNGFPSPTAGEFKQYQPVRIMRRGRIYANFHKASGNCAAYDKLNVMHATDNSGGNAQYRGFLTTDATSTSTGAEIAALSKAVAIKASANSLVLCEVNFLGDNG